MNDGARHMPTQRESGPTDGRSDAPLDRRRLPQTALLKIPRQARAVETVHTVLDAAVRVLAQEGADAFTTNRIAAVAGVSPGSLYQYVANREMILAALVERSALQAEAEVRRILRARRDLPPSAALHAALDALAGQVERHGAVVAEILRLAPLPAGNDLTTMLESRLVDALRVHLASDPAHLALRDGPAAVFVGVNACIFVLLKWAAERPPEVSRAALVNALAAALVEALGAGTAARPELTAALP